ncbi:sensor histidine kinase [Chryseobacterium lactis]|uniref:histidine kinase n=1 Tax=Chryseobacterium lactis TaxID=1241981 RepID=A0A3G6RVA5_CHRLC|nr:HAMP domain-containing sensor histidine kinase [Chryseobacterium lactis]AZA81969.1 sensor histidine kinase [Chryseobacterium lactis]AZB06967.1 sensor histidine kinase [Chryseobacterium lactis]PNW11086.1 sensor histidine kinase [Chryseobacterium lactis]
MVPKSKYLIPTFAALFLLLLGIQVYFMYKTYQVKERDIYRSVTDGLTNYIDKADRGHRTLEKKDDSLQKIIVRYYNKEISKKDFIQSFIENRAAVRNRLSNYVDSRLQKDGYKISTRIQYTSIIHLPDSIKLIDRPFTIFETKDKVKNPKIANTSSWETSSSRKRDTDQKVIERMDTFFVKSQIEFEITNIKSIVFKELALLIICCIFLLSCVLMLYISTINNLIKQQRQVEVLHTVVDNISHEFKTPVATLKIASKTLKKEWNPDTLPLIDRQISRLESLILQLHQDQVSDEITAITPEDWSFFVQDLAFTYPQTDFRFENKVSNQLPFDKNSMETIIKNLSENSVKYGASRVSITIAHSLQNLEIEVSDNGQGMENKELKNIFEKFYRIQGNNIHNTKGVGLGLYIVNKIITKYHGKINVSSQPGKGSTFSLSIPYEMPL